MVQSLELEFDLRYPAAEAVTGPTAVSTVTVFSGGGRLVGYSADGGAAAGGFAIYDGSGTVSQMVTTIAVGANASPTAWWGPGGIRLRSGLTVDVTAALSSLVLYVIPARRPGAR